MTVLNLASISWFNIYFYFAYKIRHKKFGKIKEIVIIFLEIIYILATKNRILFSILQQ